MPPASRTLDPLARCSEPRPSDPSLSCGTVLARLEGARLTIRCRHCHAAHVFVVRDGAIERLAAARATGGRASA